MAAAGLIGIGFTRGFPLESTVTIRLGLSSPAATDAASRFGSFVEDCTGLVRTYRLRRSD